MDTICQVHDKWLLYKKMCRRKLYTNAFRNDMRWEHEYEEIGYYSLF